MERIIGEFAIFHHHFSFFVAAMLLFGCAFVLAKRLIDWALDKRRVQLLSFLCGTWLFLNLFFFILIIGNEEAKAVVFLPYLLQVIGIFGFVLLIANGFKFLYKRLFDKKA